MNTVIKRKLCLIALFSLLICGWTTILEAQKTKGGKAQMEELHKAIEQADKKHFVKTKLEKAKLLESLAKQEHSFRYYLYALKQQLHAQMGLDNKDEQAESLFFDKLSKLDSLDWLTDEERCVLAIFRISCYNFYSIHNYYSYQNRQDYGKRQQSNSPRYWSETQYVQFLNKELDKVFAHKSLFDKSVKDYKLLDFTRPYEFNDLNSPWTESLGGLSFLSLLNSIRNYPIPSEGLTGLAKPNERLKAELKAYAQSNLNLDAKIGSTLLYLSYDRAKGDAYIKLYKNYLGKPELLAYFPHILYHINDGEQSSPNLLEDVKLIEKTYPKADGTLKKKLISLKKNALRPNIELMTCGNGYVFGDRTLKLVVRHSQLDLLRLELYKAPYVTSYPKLMNPKSAKDLVATYSYSFGENKDWSLKRDSISLKIPKTGHYFLKVIPKFNPRIAEVYNIKDEELVCTEIQNIYVTNQFVLQDNGDTYPNRLQYFDARTGQPLQGLKIKDDKIEEGKHLSDAILQTDKDGFVEVKESTSYRANTIVTTLDKEDPLSFLLERTYYYSPFSGDDIGIGTSNDMIASLNTDRPIYKAGQTIEIFGYVAKLSKLVSEGHVLANDSLRLSIRCQNESMVFVDLKTVDLKTDDYGNFSYRFKLDDDCKLGPYALQLKYKGDFLDSENVQVEAYQRPRYELSVQKPKQGYRLGDTIQIESFVKELNGYPLKACRLTYSVKRNIYPWSCYLRGVQTNLPEQNLVSDADGRATASIVLQKDSTHNERAFYSFEINVQATSLTGEVQTKKIMLFVGDEFAQMKIELPSFVEQNDKTKYANIELKDYSNNKLSDTLLCQVLNKKGEMLKAFSIESNKEFSLSDYVKELNSGTYTLLSSLRLKNGETIKKKGKFVLWNKHDEGINFPKEEALFLAPSDEGLKYAWKLYDTLPYVYYATAFDEPYLFYDIHDTDEKLIKKGVLRPKAKQIYRLNLPKPESLSKGLTIRLYFVRDAKLYKRRIKILPRQKEKKLSFKWEHISHRLLAGSKQEWKVRIYQDGKPVKASVSAWLYDAALNSLVSNLRKPELLSDRVAIESEFSSSLMPFVDKDILSSDKVIVCGFACDRSGDIVVGSLGKRKRAKSTLLRRDFSETAFCYPKMLTEDDGTLALSFMMPESLTRWQLYLLAHTKDLHQALYSDEINSYRELELKSFIPRFLRADDEVSIAYTLRNVSDKANKVKLKVEYYLLGEDRNFETAKRLKKSVIKRPKTQKFKLEPKQVVNGSFLLRVPSYDEDKLLGIRIKAIGKNFSDGEEHILKIKANKVDIERTQAITVVSDDEEGTSKEISLEGIYPHNFKDLKASQFNFSLESNPFLYVVDALPELLPKEDSKHAIGLMTSYYALAISSKVIEAKGIEDYISLSKPDVKTFFDKMGSESLVKARQEQIIAKLKKLQDDKGYFSWFEGMPKSDYLTEYMLSQLIRLRSIAPLNGDLKEMKQKAWEAYQEIIVKDIAHLKKEHKVYPKLSFVPRRLINFLYLSNQIKTAKSQVAQDLYSQAKDIVFANTDELYHLPLLLKFRLAMFCLVEKKVELFTDLFGSVEEHIVKDKDGACYFPSLGSYYWRNPQYTLQTEMLSYLLATENSKCIELIRGLKQWLLREKRATKWESDIATLDALYALMLSRSGHLELPQLKSCEVKLKSNNTNVKHLIGKHIDFSKGISKNPINRALIQVKGKGEVWAMGKLNYRQKLTEVKSGGKELRLERAYYLKKQVGKDMTFTELKEGDVLHKGDIIQVRLYVKLDRAMDFVQISDPRLLFAEHLDKHSRYVWDNPLTSYFYEVGQEATKLYFDKLARGEYNFHYEQAVVHSGIFSLPNASAKSIYAPEYSALTPYAGTQDVAD